jgi:pectin methylesterase-like acyl-CoA thioesterase
MLEVSKLAIPLVAGFLLCGNVTAEIIEVNPQGKASKNLDPAKVYKTIQAAVNAAQPGDVIIVDKASYTEDVLVTTASLNLRGNSGPTLLGSLTVSANNFSVVGFLIQPRQGYSGIYFNNASGSSAGTSKGGGNKITGCSVDAIDFYSSSNCSATNIEIDNSAAAFGIRNSEYLVITNNYGSGVPQEFLTSTGYSLPNATDTVNNNTFTP